MRIREWRYIRGRVEKKRAVRARPDAHSQWGPVRGHLPGDKKNGAGKYYYRDTRKMYEGEWVNDIAKCGVYSDLPAEFGGSTGAEKVLVLPTLGLKQPDQVISTAMRTT